MKKYQYRLGDLIERVIDNRGKTPPYQNEGIPIIEVASIAKNNRHPDYKKVNKYVNTETYKSWFRSGHPQNGDVLVSTVGQIGKVSIMDETVACIAQNIVALRVKKELLVPDFLYYYLIRDSVQDFLQAMNIGSAQPSIKVPHLLDLTVDIPTIETQKKIVGILKSLDDKIELNLKMNETLEEMAMTLYKHWFVDFGPFQDGEFVDSELGMIPEGWDVKEIGEVIDLAYGKALKKSDRKEGDIPVYGSSGIVGYHNESLVSGPGVVVGRKGNVGTVMWVDEDFYPIDTTFYVVTKKGINLFYAYMVLKNKNLSSLGSDSAVPGINRNIVYKQKILIPPEHVLSRFEHYISDFFKKIAFNIGENKHLQSVRDYLLPRLLSGEIDVSKAEKQVEEVL